jgi:hypothetical protein
VDTTATSGNKASSLKIEYKTKSATSWTTALSTSSTSSSGTTSTTKGTISTSSAYDVRFTVTDTTGGTATTTVSVPKAVYLLDIDSGGAGIGILATAPTSGLEIGAATSITGALTLGSPLTIANGGTGATTVASALTNLGVNDYIVSKSINGGFATWSWVKYNSGLAYCWRTDSATLSTGSSAAFSNMYYCADNSFAGVGTVAFPFTFSEVPKMSVTCETSSNVISMQRIKTTTTTAPNVAWYSNAGSNVSQEAYIHRIAIGRWK